MDASIRRTGGMRERQTRTLRMYMQGTSTTRSHAGELPGAIDYRHPPNARLLQFASKGMCPEKDARTSECEQKVGERPGTAGLAGTLQ